MVAALLESRSQTLVKLYTDSVDGVETSPEACLQFLDKNENPNVQLLRETVFRYCLGYFILKSGIRKCDVHYVNSGKDLVGDIFFAMNHPLYRKIYLYMDVDRALMSTFVKET